VVDGVNQSSEGTAKVRSIINLHLMTAQIGKPGAGPFLSLVNRTLWEDEKSVAYATFYQVIATLAIPNNAQKLSDSGGCLLVESHLIGVGLPGISSQG
jgi:hypothetical protein